MPSCRHRIGHGWDRHRLAPEGEGKPLVVGGVRLDSTLGPVAHSDGDALTHALIDALHGAATLGDIGASFPDTDPDYQNADSLTLLIRTAGMVRKAGFTLVNADVTLLLQSPKLGSARAQVQANLASALNVSADRVNVKAKTGELVGVVGRLEAIEAHAVVLLEPIGDHA